MRLLLSFLLAALAARAQITVTAATPLWVDAQAPESVRRAADDLRADLAKAFGKNPPLVSQDPGGTCVRIGVGLGAGPDTETLEIRADGGQVVLTGSDPRGTIYAVYEFARRFLEADPFHHWTEAVPPRRKQVVVPAGTRIRERPAVRYRGWFINDEDLLTGWTPGDADGTGIALATWDKIFETLLRLKGNMIVPGTFIFPDEPQVRAAGRRGLVITQHHIEVLGANTWRWPENTPYAFGSAPQFLLAAWRNSVRGYGDQEVIWTVGYRGKHDRAFWEDDPSVGPTEADRARAIRQAIDRQIELVRQERRRPYFLMNAWMESVPLIRKGLLKIPPGVTLVWPDNGHGMIRDEGDIAAGQGVYYHTAMYNSRANQLTEMVPLARIHRELGRALKAGATEYLLVNVSDIRPYPLTTRAVMELAWDPAPWRLPEAEAVTRYLQTWCREEFGERAAVAAEAYYRAYFAAPGRYGPQEHLTLADNAYHTFARHALVEMITGQPEGPSWHRPPGGLGDFLAAAGRAAAEAEPRWAQARALAERARPLVPAARRPFFGYHVLGQLAFHEHSNRMLRLVAEAYRETEPAARRRLLTEAAAEAGKARAVLDAAEYGPWRGFFRTEYFVDVLHTRALLEAAAAQLGGKPLPAGLPVRVLARDPYVPIKAYQRDRRLVVTP